MDKLLSFPKTAANFCSNVESERQFRLYTHVFECERQVLSAPHWAALLSVDLKAQGIPSDLLNAVVKKLAAVWKDIGEPETLVLVQHYLVTLGWVIGRLPKIFDWTDVMAIIDYVTRIHFGKPCVNFIVDTVFGSDAQSLDWSILKDLVSGYGSIKTHPAAIKFIKVISLAFSGGVFATLGIEAKIADIWAMITESYIKISGHTDFIAAILDLAHFIGERISAFCITGSWKSLIHTPTNYARWADKAFELLDKSVALANPDAIGMDYHKYISELAECIQQGEEIKKYVRAADERDAVSQLLSRIRVLNNDILIKNASGGFRMAPFTLLLATGSSQGKSSFMDVMIQHYAKLYDKPTGDEFIYTRTCTEEHWNGFKTFMWCCILDDVASVNPRTATADPSLADVIHIKNNVIFSPPQAAIEDKGRTPFMCELTIASTNTENLMAHAWFNNPQAIRRRLPYVVNIVPKKQYCIPGTQMLDETRIEPTLEGFYPDLWDITVKKILVNPDQTVKDDNVILQTDSIYVFIMAYNEWLEEHRRSQINFMRSKDVAKAVKLCLLHKIPVKVCPCENDLDIQAEEEELLTQGSHFSVYSGVKCAATAFATYKTMDFAVKCAEKVVGQDPTVIGRPKEFLYSTGKTMLFETKKYASNIVEQAKSFTREGIKKCLKKAFYDILWNINPLLHRIAIGLSVCVGLGLTWKFLKNEFPELVNLEPQLDIEDVGVMPEVKTEKENVWRKDDYAPTEFIGRLSQSWASIPFTKACSLVSRNTVWCQTTHKETRHTTFRAICVVGHIYAVPHHVLPMDEYFMLQVISENNTEGCNGNIRFKVAQKCIYRRPDLELAFFQIRHMPVRRNIIELFPKAGFTCDGPGRMVIRQANGSVDYLETKRTSIVKQAPLEQFNIVSDVASSVVVRDTVNGECGAIVIVQQPNACIIAGTHVLGGQRNAAVAIPITREVIAEVIDYYSTPVVETSIPYLEGQNFSTDISQRCTARFVEEGALEVFGSFGGFKKQPKSTACDTLFTQTLIDQGHRRKYGPAPMKGYTAVHIGLKSMVQKTMTFKEDVLHRCTNSYTHTIVKRLPTKFWAEMKNPLPMKVALNGMPGTKFLDSMNFGTSAGYPYNKSKRNYVTRIPADDIWQHPIVVDDIIKKEIEECWNSMSQCVSVAPVFMEHLKDEALPLRKVAAGKARLFMGGPFAWSVAVRMALLPFVRVMQLNKYLFECAPGTNATSYEWTRLHTYVTKHGPNRMIAGDFEAFDKLMGSLVILEAFRSVREIVAASGADQSHLNVIQVIAEDVAFAFVNFNGDLMRFFGSNPSGHPLTVIINCIVNSLYMRYCYAELSPDKSATFFQDDVSLITYGDDNVMGSGVDWFNHTAIAEVLLTVGVKYTMADKLAVSVPFISIDEVSFLKRTFVWNEELQAQMACLDEDSIWKSLMIFVPSKTDSPQKQCLDIVRSAVSEWFFYGRERFADEIANLKVLVATVGLECYIESNTFPSWDELAERFIDASRDYLSTEPFSTLCILGEPEWCFLNTTHKVE